MDKSSKKKAKITLQIENQSLALFATFYPYFYVLEGTLKERLPLIIKKRVDDKWLENQIKKETVNPLFNQEKKYILSRKSAEYILSEPSFILESGLGFWIELFNRDQYKLVKGAPIHIFPYLPKDCKRNDIYRLLGEAREFRNALYHSRISPLSPNNQGKKRLANILEVADHLNTLFAWLGKEAEAMHFYQKLVKEARKVSRLISLESMPNSK